MSDVLHWLTSLGPGAAPAVVLLLALGGLFLLYRDRLERGDEILDKTLAAVNAAAAVLKEQQADIKKIREDQVRILTILDLERRAG